MAWYPEARKMELQPESDSQAGIHPTQLIMHSIAAPWTKERIYEYWAESTNLESHFGQSYDGSIAQYIGTETKADANYLANRRPDGTGAVSIETASNLDHTDPWTPAQIEGLIKLGVWMHKQHGIPLRICRTADDPGYGYHRLHASWSTGGTACPGDARVDQFKKIVFPGIVARATGTPAPTTPEESDVTINKLVESNAVDVALVSGEWTGLAFTDAVVHSGPRTLVGPTMVQLTFAADTDSATTVVGRFYLTNTDGSGESGYGDVVGSGVFEGAGPQFLHNQNVPANKHLRFKVKAVSPDGSPVMLTHRVVTGDYLV